MIIAIPSPVEGEPDRIAERSIVDIAMVIIDHPQILISSAVMSSLMEAGAAFLSCGRNHLPAGLMMHLENNTLQSERFRIQLDVSQPLRKQLWQQTVACKIANQAKALELLTGLRHDNMSAWVSQVKSGDSENLEGRAAAYYWKTLFSEFPGLKRDREGEEPNSLLNYGYAVLRAIVARALVATGLHPSMGIFHKNRYNAYCLADDIMEPYRPYIDMKVFSMISSERIPSIEDKEVKREILAIATEDVIIDNRRRPLMVGVSETSASLFKCYNGELRKIKYPEIRVE